MRTLTAILAVAASAALAQPKPEETLSAVVAITAKIQPGARSAATLGTERRGSGALIRNEYVLTIGYLVSIVYVVSRRPFSGSWEYMLDSAIFTFPAVSDWSGAPLIGAKGELLGIGSLIVADAGGQGTQSPGNMFPGWASTPTSCAGAFSCRGSRPKDLPSAPGCGPTTSCSRSQARK